MRIMTLNGGGIRGVIELELLKRIEAQLCGVSIRDCFDLIVGTSAGGIIGLGLGPQELSVGECSEMFRNFAKEAFTLYQRPWIGRKLGCLTQQEFNHGKYKNKPLECALQKAFTGNSPLFGGPYQSKKFHTKVAVTTTTREGWVQLLSNYNRKPPQAWALYHFHRPGPEKDYKLWEAARATSAAPTFYAPFQHSVRPGLAGRLSLPQQPHQARRRRE